jgi:hypothetical protein
MGEAIPVVSPLLLVTARAYTIPMGRAGMVDQPQSSGTWAPSSPFPAARTALGSLPGPGSIRSR